MASLPCLSMPTLLKHAYSTRLKSSKHLKMPAYVLDCFFYFINKRGLDNDNYFGNILAIFSIPVPAVGFELFTLGL